MPYEPVLLARINQPNSGKLEGYRADGGYSTVEKAIKNLKPEDVTKQVKDSGLRGRGGAGFQTGLEWTFLPANHPGPIYLCVNADESEPCTYNNRILMEKDPHQILEGIMLACYALGIVAAAGTAFVFRRSFLKGGATSFILELPTYKLPQASQVARTVWTNTWAFVTKAGTTIFFLSVILWAMAYYPRLSESRAQSVAQEARIRAEHSTTVGRATAAIRTTLDTVRPLNAEEIYKVVANAVGAAQAEYSLSGRLGHAIEPVLRPLGFDWKIDIGLISAFAAREVFVSSMGIVYSVGDVEEGGTANLSAAMQNDRYTSGPRAGRTVWTPMVAISLLVWFVLAMQCMSTFAIVRRETGGWGWPIFMLVYMNVLAYVVSLIVYQVGSRVFG